jgi:maleamate amidohydrolase
MRNWQKMIPAGDREVHEAAGYGKRIGLGTRPATLIVDVNYQFLGRRPEPILRSVTLWPKSSGERGWAALPRIQRLLAFSRAARIPVFYTTGQTGAAQGPQSLKSGRDEGPPVEADDQAIVEQVAPAPGEVVVTKPGPSPFFGTGLLTHLVQLGVDTLLLAGCTTSGCVRATAVDAATHGFRVGVVEECVFDRFEISHAVALFDLHAKYADVMQLEDVERYLEGIPLRNDGSRSPGRPPAG